MCIRDRTCTSDVYSVTDVDVINDDGEWVSGDVPRVEITLEADDDYYFASMSSSKVKLKGDDATYVSSHREDSSSTLVITIKLDALEGSMEIENVAWENDDSPIAIWDEAAGAKSYQVRLYRDSSSVGEAVTTSLSLIHILERHLEGFTASRNFNDGWMLLDARGCSMMQLLYFTNQRIAAFHNKLIHHTPLNLFQSPSISFVSIPGDVRCV